MPFLGVIAFIQMTLKSYGVSPYTRNHKSCISRVFFFKMWGVLQSLPTHVGQQFWGTLYLLKTCYATSAARISDGDILLHRRSPQRSRSVVFSLSSSHLVSQYTSAGILNVTIYLVLLPMLFDKAHSSQTFSFESVIFHAIHTPPLRPKFQRLHIHP